MNSQQDKLAQLRRRAEVLLKHAVDTQSTASQTMDEIIHELDVYHTEISIQLEDLQQSYEALEIAQERYASLFDFAPVGYIITNTEGLVISANQTASSLLGVERQLLEQSYFSQVIAMDFQDIYHVHRRLVLKTQQAQTCELQLQNTNGRLFYAQLNTDLPNVSSGSLRTAITDISMIKQAEDTLRRSLEHEKQVNLLRNRMLLVISHEFRTPLAVILSLIEILESYGERLSDEKKKQHYQTIRNFVWYLNDVVENARSIDISYDLLSLKFTRFDVISLIEQIVNDMQLLAKEGQFIELEVLRSTESSIITWNENLVRRIVMNLLSNAIHYSTQSIQCLVECEAHLIRVSVIDQGIGILEEDKAHIYEAFYRGANAMFIPGTGMGLFITQQAVQGCGGSIQFSSQVGQGSRFTVELPHQAIIHE